MTINPSPSPPPIYSLSFSFSELLKISFFLVLSVGICKHPCAAPSEAALENGRVDFVVLCLDQSELKLQFPFFGLSSEMYLDHW